MGGRRAEDRRHVEPARHGEVAPGAGASRPHGEGLAGFEGERAGRRQRLAVEGRAEAARDQGEAERPLRRGDGEAAVETSIAVASRGLPTARLAVANISGSIGPAAVMPKRR